MKSSSEIAQNHPCPPLLLTTHCNIFQVGSFFQSITDVSNQFPQKSSCRVLSSAQQYKIYSQTEKSNLAKQPHPYTCQNYEKSNCCAKSQNYSLQRPLLVDTTNPCKKDARRKGSFLSLPCTCVQYWAHISSLLISPGTSPGSYLSVQWGSLRKIAGYSQGVWITHTCICLC